MRWSAALAGLAVAGCLDAPPAALDRDGGDGGDADPGPPVLLAALPFDQPDPLADASGNGHDARCDGSMCPSWILDREELAEAALFDGASQYLLVDPLGAGPFTVMAWLRLEGTADGGLACPLNRPFGASGINSWQLCVLVPSEGQAQLYLFTVDEPHELVADVLLDLGVWHHVAIRWDGSLKTIFWDGEQIAAGEGKTRFDESEIRLGSDIDGEVIVAWFPGALDQVEVWDGALPAGAIQEAAGAE